MRQYLDWCGGQWEIGLHAEEGIFRLSGSEKRESGWIDCEKIELAVWGR